MVIDLSPAATRCLSEGAILQQVMHLQSYRASHLCKW